MLRKGNGVGSMYSLPYIMKNDLSKEIIREVEMALFLVNKAFENTVIENECCDYGFYEEVVKLFKRYMPELYKTGIFRLLGWEREEEKS
jgi:hypothetical protein